MFIVPSHPDDVSYRLDVLQTKASSVRTKWFSVWTLLCIEKLLFQLASIWTTLSDRSSFRFSFQKLIWEDCCNRPDDVDSHPDALLLKASSQFKLNRPNASLPWSERAYDRYENCVQQITCLDVHPHDPDARSLNKEITCSGSATVWTIVPHRPDAALKRERFLAKISEFCSHSCPSGRRPALSSQMLI
jgi:hypothetical protein